MSDEPVDGGLPRFIGEELQVSFVAVTTLYEMLIDTGVVSRESAVARLKQTIDDTNGSYTTAGLQRLANHLDTVR